MPKDKEVKISTREALDSLAKYVPDVIFAAVSALVVVNPIWAILFLTGKGIYGAWGDFGESRLRELAIDLEKNKDTFSPKILKTDKFKSIFLDTVEKHMKESSETRRHLLRKYLISVAQGKNTDFDYHTKLLNVLDQITGDEFRLFILLPNIIKDSNDELLHYKTNEERQAFNPSEREIRMNTLQVKMRLKDWKIKTQDLAALIRFLTNYGIIISYDVSISGIGGGGGNDLVFAGLTDVGKAFYDFIDSPELNKEITTYIAYKNDPSLALGLQY